MVPGLPPTTGVVEGMAYVEVGPTFSVDPIPPNPVGNY